MSPNTTRAVPEHELPPRVVEAHDRYLREVVEGLSLCPFARRSREEGRVERRFFRVTDPQPPPQDFARALQAALDANPDVEIVLLTFLVEPDHPWHQPAGFERFLPALRQAHEALSSERFFLVTFHPDVAPDPERPLTPDSLVPLIRRAPDPTIQCTRAAVLDEVRRAVRARSPERLVRELEAQLGPLDQAMRALLANSIQTDSRLSSEIAEHNFRAIGHGEGRARFEALIAQILAARRGRGEPP